MSYRLLEVIAACGLVALVACSSGTSSSSSSGGMASSSGGSSGGSSSGGVQELKPNPTGALGFTLVGDGRASCGGRRSPATACATTLPIVIGAEATVRLASASRPLLETDTPEVEWVGAAPTSGGAKVVYEGSWYCDNNTFQYRKVARKQDCTGGAVPFFEHFVRVSMPTASLPATEREGRGFLRVKLAGEVVDEHALAFVRPAELRVALSPVKQSYALTDIVNVIPSMYAQPSATEPMYAERGAVTCEVAPGSAGDALGTSLSTPFVATPGGLELQFRRAGVVVNVTCTAASGLGFSNPLNANIVVAP